MKIGLDFSGTIANHLVQKAAFAKKILGIAITEREARKEALIEYMGEGAYSRFTLAFSTRSFSQRIQDPLYQGVREALLTLDKKGHKLVLITTRHTMTLISAISAYITLHHLPIRDIVAVSSDDKKANVCREHGVSVFFDDNRSVLEKLIPLGIKLVWADFYNTDSAESRFSIAHSWQEFVEIIENTIGGKHF